MLKRILTSAGVVALSSGMAYADYALTILHTNDFPRAF